MGRPKGIIQKIAEQCGVDQNSVRRALKAAGESITNPDFENAVEIVKAVADGSKVLGHATNGRGEGGDAKLNELATIKAEHARQQANKIRIQNERALGKLVSRDDVTETGKRIIAEARTALIAAGHRAAARITGKSSPREIADIIEAEIVVCLGYLSDPTPFLTRVLDDEALG